MRLAVRPYTEKQIELVTTFADQAVIAIENVRLFEAEQQRTRELAESLEQQTATSDVLQVISSSHGDLQPVFATILEKAARICGAKYGFLWLTEGDGFRPVAYHGLPPALETEFPVDRVLRPEPDLPLARLARSKQVVHVLDARTEPGYLRRYPPFLPLIDMGGARTLLLVPVLKEDVLVGAIAIYRQEVHPFTDKQIALVANFASQAVIAIENTRLLNELRARTADLSESLEQQTATTELLQVINQSPGDLGAVFDAMLEKAMRVCGAAFGVLATYDGETFRTAATRGVPEAYARYRKENPPAYGPGTGPMRILAGERVIHVVDLMDEDAYRTGEPNRRALVHLGGARTSLHVALSSESTLLGSIQIYRQEVRPFSDKEIALLQNFAAQAVIAIENARLLSELRESLEQQTATSAVLGIISSSPGELDPVFKAILENAARICQAQFGTLNIYDGSAFRSVALHNPPPQFAMRLGEVIRPHPESGLAYVARTKQIVHIDDIRTRQPYLEGDKAVVGLADLAGARTLLAGR